MKTLARNKTGLTVRELRTLLRLANPDAVVVFNGESEFSFVREAELDALPPGFDNRPCVNLRGVFKDN